MHIVHYLDVVRHALAFMWSYWNWIGNISAGIIVTIFMSLLWPQLRHRIEKWTDAKLHTHFSNHHESLKQHIDDHMAEVHKKLDK